VTLLQRHRPLIVSELNAWTAANPTGIESAQEALRLLSRFDYSLWDLDTGLRTKPESPPWMVMAVPREKEEDVRRPLTPNS